MKERILKRGVLLLLIAVVICGGILYASPDESSAASSVLYNVEILDMSTPFDKNNPTENNESPYVTYQVPGKEIPDPIITSQEGITFQMLVAKKAKTETLKVGKTKTKASYYPVTILKKTYKDPGAEYPVPYGEEMLTGLITTTLTKDAKGKLYVSGGDVDVSNVQAESKLKQTIGDGTTDPEGSLIVPIMLLDRSYYMIEKGVTFAREKKLVTTLTTGQSSTLVQKSKSALEGKTYPDDDTSGMIATPLVGVPVDLEAGTGTLVCTQVAMNQNLMVIGKTDFPKCYVWTMKITPASK